MCVQHNYICMRDFDTKKDKQKKIFAFEIYCYRWILPISWTQKVTNVEIRKRLNVKEGLIQKVMKRKLKLLGHIARMENRRKVRNVMLGIMEGINRKVRHGREWLDDMKEWCQKDMYLLCETPQEWSKWRWLVKCSWDTYRLCARGSWWWWWWW